MCNRCDHVYVEDMESYPVLIEYEEGGDVTHSMVKKIQEKQHLLFMPNCYATKIYRAVLSANSSTSGVCVCVCVCVCV